MLFCCWSFLHSKFGIICIFAKATSALKFYFLSKEKQTEHITSNYHSSSSQSRCCSSSFHTCTHTFRFQHLFCNLSQISIRMILEINCLVPRSTAHFLSNMKKHSALQRNPTTVSGQKIASSVSDKQYNALSIVSVRRFWLEKQDLLENSQKKT